MRSLYKFWLFVVRLLIFFVALMGILFLARIVLVFFGFLKTFPGYDFIINATNPFISPFKMSQLIKTPYEGEFDIVGVAFLIIFMIFEYPLASFRSILKKAVDRADREYEERKKQETKKELL
ncbi:MAG: hypothetical protein HY776_01780 [Actinobacteria bacterium]|nr:hypothetical protein [Actinomycetota bacterium]